ncbi:MAG: outer membrane protein assembly factor BamA, partial [Deltaproteobacteria bacterium]
QFGAGYSSVYGVVGTVALSERNLFGRAWRAYIRATLGGGMSDFSLGMSDPRFLDTSYSVGFDAFNETYDYDTYDSRVTGGDLKVGRELTDYLRADLVYRYERVKIYNVEEEASSYIKSQEGTTDTSKVTLTLTFDNIDDPLNPTRGIETWFSVCNAGGPLGGDNYFWRVSTGASWFHPLIGDLVLNLRGRFGLMEGYSGREVPLGEKFYVGGLRTLRGFEYGMAGPVDENREPIGSLKMAVLNVEFIYPLSKALGLKAAVFYDVGKGFDDWSDITPLRHAAGVGIRWYSPFGPIRIDWGYNLNRRKGEKASVWDFAVGMMY